MCKFNYLYIIYTLHINDIHNMSFKKETFSLPYTPVNLGLSTKKGRHLFSKLYLFNLAQAEQIRQTELEQLFGDKPKETDHRQWPLFPERLTVDQMRQVKAEFIKQIDAGLDEEASSLAMIDSQFDQEIMDQEVETGSRSLVIDAGGTSLKFQIFEQTESGLVADTDQNQTKIPFPKTKWTGPNGAEDYFNFIAEQLSQHFSTDVLARIDAIGFIFSFPADARKNERGVDLATDQDSLTKEWIIEGLTETGSVGEQLFAALHRQFAYNVDDKTQIDQISLAVMNDTIAIVGDEIGAINATGMNIAALINGHLYNLEAGAFDAEKLPKSLLMKTFDEDSEKPESQQAEKLISGYAVEMQLKIFIEKAVIHHQLPQGLLQNLDDNQLFIVIDWILSSEEDADQWLKIENWFDTYLSSEQKKLLFDVCQRIVDNSASYFASIMMAVVERVDQDLAQSEYQVPIEGPFFWNSPQYHDRVMSRMAEINDQNLAVTLVGGPNQRLSLEGAAVKSLKVNSYQQKN